MDSYYDIIYYCLGSNRYRQEFQENFLQALREIEAKKLVGLLNKFHLLGLFYHEIKRLAVDNKILNLVEPFIFYQNILNSLLIEELNQISKDLKRYNLKPIILKGPSFWEEFYEFKFMRKVDDLDFMFLKLNEIDKFCDLLISIGYDSKENKTYKLRINDSRYFGLAHFYKTKKIKLNKEYNEKIEHFFDTIYEVGLNGVFYPKIKKMDDGIYVKIQIEPHKFIFAYGNGEFPTMDEKYFKCHSVLKDFYVFKNFPNLPYIATKFFHDVNVNQPKCLKLFADFIKIIVKCDEEEIQESIKLASIWRVTDMYLIMLNSVRNFTPELNLQNLSASSINPLSNLLKKHVLH